MKKLILGFLALGLTTQMYAQVVAEELLTEVIVVATNYKYLNDVSRNVESVPVQLLQDKVATYDLKNSELYQDDYDTYEISFFIPEGRILAAYDKDGNIIRTIEKFQDITLPKEVSKAVANRFPGWKISKDVYLVHYNEQSGTSKKYKITLTNGDQRIKVKVDDKGTFI
jgi:hypothetical protein